MLIATIKRYEEVAGENPELLEWLDGRHMLTIAQVIQKRKGGRRIKETHAANYLVTAHDLEEFKTAVASLTV